MTGADTGFHTESAGVAYSESGRVAYTESVGGTSTESAGRIRMGSETESYRGTYEEILGDKGFLLLYTRGRSMEPMLRQGQEQSLIRSPEALGREPEKYDVVLFRRGEEYVLHRIVGREGELFRIRGDNCITWDLVSRAKIIGILEGFYRGQTYVDCTQDRDYKRYVRRRCMGFPLRRLWGNIRHICHMGKKLLRKEKKGN